jgi:hypothetical protein
LEQHQPDWNSPADKVARDNNGLARFTQAAMINTCGALLQGPPVSG